jgi:hypothetical protein
VSFNFVLLSEKIVKNNEGEFFLYVKLPRMRQSIQDRRIRQTIPVSRLAGNDSGDNPLFEKQCRKSFSFLIFHSQLIRKDSMDSLFVPGILAMKADSDSNKP